MWALTDDAREYQDFFRNGGSAGALPILLNVNETPRYTSTNPIPMPTISTGSTSLLLLDEINCRRPSRHHDYHCRYRHERCRRYRWVRVHRQVHRSANTDREHSEIGDPLKTLVVPRQALFGRRAFGYAARLRLVRCRRNAHAQLVARRVQPFMYFWLVGRRSTIFA